MYYYIGTAELVFQQILLPSISLFVNLLALPMDPDPFLLTLIYFYSPCVHVLIIYFLFYLLLVLLTASLSWYGTSHPTSFPAGRMCSPQGDRHGPAPCRLQAPLSCSAAQRQGAPSWCAQLPRVLPSA